MSRRHASVKTLGTFALAGMVISSMVGGGIFSLPQNMAAASGVGAIMLAWLITGLGIFFIANTFKILSLVRPDLTTGIYMYSREGFGPYIGFTIAWGYWLCQIFGNVGYAVITMDALNYFFPPYFEGGNTFLAIVCGSALIWVFNFIILKGIRQASSINVIGTICKLVPLLVFILITAFFFKLSIFKADMWGHKAIAGQPALGSIASQLKSTMLVTLWSFIGIESAVVMSERAKSVTSIGRATVLGFLGCLVIYALLSILPFGFLTQQQLATIPNPSTAGILKSLVGNWGAVFMNLGLIIAILTSWLSWTMIVAQIPYSAAKNGTFPPVFALENKHRSPQASLYISSVVMQIVIIFVYFASDAWSVMLNITSAMVLPAYLASTLFLLKMCLYDSFPKNRYIKKTSATITAILASLYALWLTYSGGKYLFFAVILLALGIPLYMEAIYQERKTFKKTPFLNKRIMIEMTAVSLLALFAIFLISTKRISL